MPVPRAEYLAGLPRKVVGAGALITDSDGRPLVVKPNYKPRWELPGGTVEAGESARGACARELHEELGVTSDIGRILVIEHQTLPDDKGDSIMIIYDGGVSRAVNLRVSPDELTEFCFVAVADIGEYLPLRQARRIAAAVDARATGTVIELVDGERA